jgi:hypothetical protein
MYSSVSYPAIAAIIHGSTGVTACKPSAVTATCKGAMSAMPGEGGGGCEQCKIVVIPITCLKNGFTSRFII